MHSASWLLHFFWLGLAWLSFTVENQCHLHRAIWQYCLFYISSPSNNNIWMKYVHWTMNMYTVQIRSLRIWTMYTHYNWFLFSRDIDRKFHFSSSGFSIKYRSCFNVCRANFCGCCCFEANWNASIHMHTVCDSAFSATKTSFRFASNGNILYNFNIIT